MAGNRKLANIGKAVDSAASGDFLGLDDSGGVFKDVQWDNITGKPTVLDSAATIGLIDSAYVQARQTDVGIDSAAITNLVDSSYVQLRVGAGGLDSGLTTGLIDSAYISARVTSGLDSSGTLNLVDSNYISSRASASSGFSTFKYTATAGQTTFDSTDANGNTLSYTADGILVFYNGILMLPTYDYTATDGTSVVLTAGADSGSIITIGEWALGSSSSSSSSFSFGGDRGLFATGRNLSVGFYNYTDYFDITTPGNASEFGSPGTARSFVVGASSTTRGLTAGGFNSSFTNTDDIDYYTIASPGNATSFGNLASAKYGMQAVSSGTYAVFAGGSDNEIQYVTIDTTGNTTDFGDLTSGSTPAGQHSVTDGSRGVFIHSSNTDSMQYITIASPGNATDFGDLAVTAATAGSTSNTTMGLYANSGNIYKITIATTGNSVDWGYDAVNTWSERNFGVITNNTRGIFAGGTQSTTGKADIEYVTFDVPSNGTDFGDLGIARGYGAGFAGNAS
jgi:hypothetical protein